MNSKLERGGNADSLPRLAGNAGVYDDAASRRSGIGSMTSSKRLHQSTDILRPLKAERSLMKVTGSHIMGKAESNLGRNSVHSSIDYGINANQSSPKRKDLYGDITIGHMMTTEAKAQFEGNVSRYPVPNNDAKIYKIHG